MRVTGAGYPVTSGYQLCGCLSEQNQGTEISITRTPGNSNVNFSLVTAISNRN